MSVLTSISACILRHRICGFKASEGLPNKHKVRIFYYANYANSSIAYIQEKNKRCNLEIAKCLIEEYKRFLSSVLDIRNLILLNFRYILLKNF